MHSLWAFVLLAVALSVTPGPDDLLVIRSTVLAGSRSGMTTALGAGAGSLVWGAAAATGLAAAVSRSSGPADWIRLVGAGYLAVLGVVTLRPVAAAAGRTRTARRPSVVLGGRRPAGAAFATGLLSDLLNPKIGAFYLAVLPQFIPRGQPVLQYSLLLCALDVALATCWLFLLAWLAHRAQSRLRRPAAGLWSQRMCGAVLIGLGATVALGG